MKFYLHLSWTQAHVSTTHLMSLVSPLLSRIYHAEKLPKTNLVFVIADAKLTCLSCDTRQLIQDEQQCILLPSAAVIWHRTCTLDSASRCLEIVVFDKMAGDGRGLRHVAFKQIFSPLTVGGGTCNKQQNVLPPSFCRRVCFPLSVILTTHYFPHLSEHFRSKWHLKFGPEFRCVYTGLLSVCL